MDPYTCRFSSTLRYIRHYPGRGPVLSFEAQNILFQFDEVNKRKPVLQHLSNSRASHFEWRQNDEIKLGYEPQVSSF